MRRYVVNGGFLLTSVNMVMEQTNSPLCCGRRGSSTFPPRSEKEIALGTNYAFPVERALSWLEKGKIQYYDRNEEARGVLRVVVGQHNNNSNNNSNASALVASAERFIQYHSHHVIIHYQKFKMQKLQTNHNNPNDASTLCQFLYCCNLLFCLSALFGVGENYIEKYITINFSISVFLSQMHLTFKKSTLHSLPKRNRKTTAVQPTRVPPVLGDPNDHYNTDINVEWISDAVQYYCVAVRLWELEAYHQALQPIHLILLSQPKKKERVALPQSKIQKSYAKLLQSFCGLLKDRHTSHVYRQDRDDCSKMAHVRYYYLTSICSGEKSQQKSNAIGNYFKDILLVDHPPDKDRVTTVEIKVGEDFHEVGNRLPSTEVNKTYFYFVQQRRLQLLPLLWASMLLANHDPHRHPHVNSLIETRRAILSYLDLFKHTNALHHAHTTHHSFTFLLDHALWELIFLAYLSHPPCSMEELVLFLSKWDVVLQGAAHPGQEQLLKNLTVLLQAWRATSSPQTGEANSVQVYHIPLFLLKEANQEKNPLQELGYAIMNQVLSFCLLSYTSTPVTANKADNSYYYRKHVSTMFRNVFHLSKIVELLTSPTAYNDHNNITNTISLIEKYIDTVVMDMSVNVFATAEDLKKQSFGNTERNEVYKKETDEIIDGIHALLVASVQKIKMYHETEKNEESGASSSVLDDYLSQYEQWRANSGPPSV